MSELQDKLSEIIELLTDASNASDYHRGSEILRVIDALEEARTRLEGVGEITSTCLGCGATVEKANSFCASCQERVVYVIHDDREPWDSNAEVTPIPAKNGAAAMQKFLEGTGLKVAQCKPSLSRFHVIPMIFNGREGWAAPHKKASWYKVIS